MFALLGGCMAPGNKLRGTPAESPASSLKGVVRPLTAYGITDVGALGLPIGFAVEYSSLNEFSAADVDAIAAGVTLRTWPEMDVIALGSPLIDATFSKSKRVTVEWIPASVLQQR